MDSVVESLVEYALAFDSAELGDQAVFSATLNHVVDSIGVAIAGTAAEPAQIATKLARSFALPDGATVIGDSVRCSPDLAAFANSIMVRTFDWNDGMQAKGGGHPSDMIPGVLAVAELAHAEGMETLTSIALAYELLGGLGSACDRKGYDQGLFMGVSVALATAKLLGLTRDEMAYAASLAMTTALPLQVNRWGALSMMKGAATAFAVRNGVFTTLLASEGFTSAPEPFEGYFGLWNLTGEFRPRLPVMPDGPRVVQMSHQKPVPAETQVLGLLDLIPEIRSWTSVEDIESIVVELSERGVRHVADESKYDPQTRETADHSLPYMLAVALVDGTITLGSYRRERFLDPSLRPLMKRISVRPNDSYSEIRNSHHYGVSLPTPAMITITTAGGEQFVREVMYHRGHMRDPMSRHDIDVKWDAICEGRLTTTRSDEIRDAWWRIAESGDVSALMRMLANVGSPSESPA